MSDDYERDKPHWKIQFKKTARSGGRGRPFLIKCILYRGAHKKAPLKEYKTLTDIGSHRLTDEFEALRFWRSVRRELDGLSHLIDAETRDRLRAQIACRVPEPPEPEPIPLRIPRPPSANGLPGYYPPPKRPKNEDNETE